MTTIPPSPTTPLQSFLSHLFAQPTSKPLSNINSNSNANAPSSIATIIKHELDWNNAARAKTRARNSNSSSARSSNNSTTSSSSSDHDAINNNNIITHANIRSAFGSFAMEMIEPTLTFLRTTETTTRIPGDEGSEPAPASESSKQKYSLYGYESGTMEFQILGTIRFASFLVQVGNESGNGGRIGSGSGDGITNHKTRTILTQHAAHSLNHLTKHILDGSKRIHTPQQFQLHMYAALLLEIIEPIAGVNQACAMAWRGICDILLQLKSPSQSSVHGHGHAVGRSSGCEKASMERKRDVNLNYKYLTVRAIRRITVLLKEGFQAMSLHNAGNSDSTGNAKNGSKQQQQMKKLLKFFVMRLMQLMSIVQNSGDSNYHGKDDADADGAMNVASILPSLLELGGTIIERDLNQMMGSSIGSGNVNGDLNTVAQMLHQKVNTCLEKMFLHSIPLEGDVTCNSNGTGTDGDTALFHVAAMQTFLRCTHNSNANDIDGTFQKQHHASSHSSSTQRSSSFRLGKLDTALYLMENCRVSMLLLLEKAGNGNGTAFQLREIDLNCILSLCENVLFQSSPQCFEYMTMGNVQTMTDGRTAAMPKDNDIFLCKIIEVISNTLLVLDKISSTLPNEGTLSRICSARRRIHHTLLRWLANPNKKGSGKNRRGRFSANVHPLTTELVLDIIHVYIVRSRNCSNITGIIRTMAKLVFDLRTERVHRRNIGIVLHMLWKMKHPHTHSINRLQGTVESALVQAFEHFLGTLRSHILPDSLGKRKRLSSSGSVSGSYNTWSTVDGLDEIAPLIGALSSSGLLWSKMSTAQCDNLMDDASNILPSKCSQDGAKRQRICSIIKEAPDLLYVFLCILHGGAMQHSNNHQQLWKDRQQHSFELLCLGLSQVQLTRYNGLTLFRITNRIISSVSSKSITSKHLQQLGVILKTSSSQKVSVSYQFGGTILLSVISSIIASRGSEVMKSSIASSFSSLLSKGNANIVANGMSSLELFAKKVTDKNFLLSCVPNASKALLQARLKNEVYCFLSKRKTMVTPKQLFSWRKEESGLLYTNAMFANVAFQNPTSTNASISITAGSKILRLTNPNHAGQIALVILPPGETDFEFCDICKWHVEEGK